ncbi:hypothetical protein FGO68_gene1262 [Halteria grandinella]|uniref:Cyclic nucleotide-binding domain-containing protein n=1 Tax=Halteria grandinella TaxID=5974 RepID=A0A8J8T6M9_HALGN|nr:hypothetical protein FGO68_gene1262 [Halteria grandinella]
MNAENGFRASQSMKQLEEAKDDGLISSITTQKGGRPAFNPSFSDDDDDEFDREVALKKSITSLKRQKTMNEKEEIKRRKAEKFIEDQRLRNIKNYDYFVILPDDHFKKKWDILITLMLLFTAFVSPYRIAFIDQDSVPWVVIESATDCVFGFDMILNFFFAFYDDHDEVIDDRKKIALTYLQGWFTIDLFTILPISQILNTTDYGNLARIARLPKLYRLIKILRLVRILKVVKERQMLIKYVNEVFRLNTGFERLIFFMMMSIVVCHICCCFWVILANLYQDSEEFQDTWVVRLNYVDESDSVVYIASMYFVLTTFTTVGFGDISGVTIAERIYCIALSLIGAVAFSFAISSLSSMLSALDTRTAQLRERMGTLNQIKRQYRLSFDLYRRLKGALKYDYSKNSTKHFQILNELPQNLRIELALLMNKEIIKKVFFFRNKPAIFIAFIGPLLKPLRIEIDNFIYREGDPIEEIYFLIKGKASFVSQKMDEIPYLIIEAGLYFGEIDFLYQSYLMSQKGDRMNSQLSQDAKDTVQQIGGSLKRAFPVKAIENCDLLTLSKQDLARVEAEFEDIVAEMFVHTHKKIKKILRIKDEAEQQYLRRQLDNQRNILLNPTIDGADAQEGLQLLWMQCRRPIS